MALSDALDRWEKQMDALSTNRFLRGTLNGSQMGAVPSNPSKLGGTVFSGAGDIVADVLNAGKGGGSIGSVASVTHPEFDESLVPANQRADYVPEASGIGASISEWFVRGAVVILGFIFVAVGLAMFKPNVMNVVTKLK